MWKRSILARVARFALFAATLGVCLPRLSAQPAAAKVTALTGQVSVLRDNAPWALNIGDSIQPRQIVITGSDGFAIFQVSDGSTFEVFPNSRMIFRESPSNWKDLLDVLIGRVKVHIQKLGGQPNYNRVRTPTAVISVRGTVFDVVVEDEDATTLVSVEEGQVAVENSQMPGPARLLNPGDSIRVYKNQPLAKSVDKGSIAEGALRAAAQVFYEVLLRTSRASSGPGTVAGGGTAPLPGDRGGTTTGGGSGTGSQAPPPAPPPPPPPPPPPAQ